MAGENRSFEALAMPHLDLLYRVAYRLTRREHEAEDLVQETFLKAYRAFDSFEEREFGIRPWLLRILHNTYLNRAARERRAPRATEQQTLAQTEASEVAHLPVLDLEQVDDQVKQAVDGLSPEFRAVVLLWATGEFSYQQIADALELPIGTVMSRLHRARRQLARALHDFAREHRIATKRAPS